MRVLVSGAAGRIGAAASQFLGDLGANVRGVDLHPPNQEVNDFVVGDCRSPAVARAAVDGVDVLLHLAAQPSPDPVEPEKTYLNNTQASFSLIYAAALAGVRRIVAASSIAVIGTAYSPAQKPRLGYLPIDEAIPVEPADTYALAKEADEATLRMVARRFELSTLGLRLPFVGDSPQLQSLGTQAVQSPADRYRELWAYLDLRDACTAMGLAIQSDSAGAGVLNVIAPNSLGGVDVATQIQTFFPAAILRDALPPGQGAYSTALAESVIGFRAEWCWCGARIPDHSYFHQSRTP